MNSFLIKSTCSCSEGYDEMVLAEGDFTRNILALFEANNIPINIYHLVLDNLSLAYSEYYKLSIQKDITGRNVTTRHKALKSVEIALVYYIFFRSRGLKANQISKWFGSIIEKIRQYRNSDELPLSTNCGYINYVSNDKEIEVFDSFSSAFLSSIRVTDDTGSETMQRYIQYSDSKSTVFNSKKQGVVNTAKLMNIWTNFDQLKIEYDTQSLSQTFDHFISDPIAFLKGH